jgi:uncharacterized membrane protein
MLWILAALLLVLSVIGPIFGIIAFARTQDLVRFRESIAALEGEIAELKRRIRTLQDKLRSEGAAPPESVAPPPTPPQVVAAPAVAPSRSAVPPVFPPSSPTPPPSPARPARPAPPAPPAPRPIEPSEPAPEPRAPIEWERWIGIRGAAVLGGIVLALAGLLFFQYSIQHGLITPPMRVVLGLGVGIFSIVASEWLRPRGYRSTPEGLAGAGVVVLYAAIWAGHSLYHLIPIGLAFALMILVTAACGLLAVRHGSQLVAVLGLLGGFATPLLLQSDADRPIGLFGYVLLLDLGLIAVGKRKRWPWLGLLGLLGTILLQGLWIGSRMGPDRLFLGLAILAVFAVVFAASGFLAGEGEREISRLGQVGGILVPFLFSIYFAARVDLGPHLWPVAILLAILGAGASWVGREQRTPWLGLAAAVGCVGVFAVWQLRVPSSEGSAWESVAIAVGLAALFHLFVELDRDPPGMEGPAPAAMASAGGFLVILVLAAAASGTTAPWTWLFGWIALSVLLYRHAAFPERETLQLAASLGVAGGLSLELVIHGELPSFPPIGLFLGVSVAVAALAQGAALLRRGSEVRKFADHAAAALAGVLSLSLAVSSTLPRLAPPLGLGVPVVLGILVLLAAARRGAGILSLGALVSTAAVHLAWTWSRPDLAGDPAQARMALGIFFASAAVWVIWPFVAGRALQGERTAWYAASLAGPVWFFPAKRLWDVGVGSGSIGLLPILLGALALAAAAGARRAPVRDDSVRKSALVGFAAVAICFASVAIPLQLEKSWITIGWAIEGLALIALWRRLDHAGLKWLALAHLAAATVRLFPTAALLDSYPRSGTPFLNWVLYTYLVPAAALFASARLLAPDESGRARPWERELYSGGKPVGAVGATIAGIFVVFVWINLAIADWFAEGPHLTLRFGRSPARDLTVSIAWAVYALTLLGFGMIRASSGLRWLSLGFLVVTIGKVFLYDLGELRDLYRVVSLVGLAISLLLVSLLYQRFVFRRNPGERS